jgi:hypothetical protein
VCKEKSSESPESECWALLRSLHDHPGSEHPCDHQRDGLLDVRSVVRPVKYLSASGSVQKWAGRSELDHHSQPALRRANMGDARVCDVARLGSRSRSREI